MFEGKFIAVLTILNVTFGCVTAATSTAFVASLTSCTGLRYLVHAGGGGGPALPGGGGGGGGGGGAPLPSITKFILLIFFKIFFHYFFKVFFFNFI